MINQKFLSTLSLRRATSREWNPTKCQDISIHALLAESDIAGRITSKGTKISIHALLAESDLFFQNQFFIHNLFLSTLSLRRATKGTSEPVLPQNHFYPRSPCGERHRRVNLFRFQAIISIHALLAESDAPQPPQGESSKKFLSTLSLRRATVENGTRPSARIFLSTLSLRRATASHLSKFNTP